MDCFHSRVFTICFGSERDLEQLGAFIRGFPVEMMVGVLINLKCIFSKGIYYGKLCFFLKIRGGWAMERKIRVLIAKPGLDGHDRGAKVIARALRDAGFEVIYTGIRRTPAEIAETALQEDVDVLGLSILSGAHLELIPSIIDELKARGIDPRKDLLVVVGGIIPAEDISKLKKIGVAEVFVPGTPMHEIIEFIKGNAGKKVVA